MIRKKKTQFASILGIVAIAAMIGFGFVACGDGGDGGGGGGSSGSKSDITWTLKQVGGALDDDGETPATSTTAIKITFEKSVILMPDDVIVSGAFGSALPLIGVGKEFTIPIVVTKTENANVRIIKDGVDSASKNIMVYKEGEAQPITYSAVANGSPEILTSTEIVFKFSKSLTTSLDVNDITIDEWLLANVDKQGRATKGTSLTSDPDDNTKYTLSIDRIKEGNIRVTINGTNISSTTTEVAVYSENAAVPEDQNEWERWSYNWAANPSDKKAENRINAGGVAEIKVTGAGTQVENKWDIWRANCRYQYTAKKDSSYEYKFYAWTTDEPGDIRDLVVQYYTDDPKGIYLNKMFQEEGKEENGDYIIVEDNRITSTKTEYTIYGKPIPKSGIFEIEFQCATQTGTFYVEMISIKELPKFKFNNFEISRGDFDEVFFSSIDFDSRRDMFDYLNDPYNCYKLPGQPYQTDGTLLTSEMQNLIKENHGNGANTFINSCLSEHGNALFADWDGVDKFGYADPNVTILYLEKQDASNTLIWLFDISIYDYSNFYDKVMSEIPEFVNTKMKPADRKTMFNAFNAKKKIKTKQYNGQTITLAGLIQIGQEASYDAMEQIIDILIDEGNFFDGGTDSEYKNGKNGLEDDTADVLFIERQ